MAAPASRSDDVALDVVGDFLNPSMGLLTHYREKIKEFEHERGVYLARLADIDGQQAEVHRLRWEMGAREEEIQELQAALGDCKLYLYDERQQVLTLQAENDSLKAQEIEDRRRIQHLLAMTQPVAHEVTFLRDARPVQPPGSVDAPTHHAPPQKMRVGSGVMRAPASVPLGRASFGTAPPGAEPVAPATSEKVTIVTAASTSAAGASEDVLQMTVESLRRQLSDARSLHDERVKAFMRDREAMKADFERKAAADAAALRQVEKQLAITSEKFTNLTRDYLMQRHSFNQRERAAAEQVAVLHASAMRAEAALRETTEVAQRDMRALRTHEESKVRTMKSALITKTEQAADEMRVTESRHESSMRKAEERIEQLEEHLAVEKRRYRDLQVRRAREIEGYNTDVTLMRKALRQLEQQWVSVGGMVTDAALRTAAMDAAAAVRQAMGHVYTHSSGDGPVESELVDAAAAPVLNVAQHLAGLLPRVRPRGRSNSSGGQSLASSQDRSRSASSSQRRGPRGEPRWGGLTASSGPAAWDPVPAAVVADPAQRGRLRQKGALLQDHPVLYRSVRSSGYGRTSGRGTLIDAAGINDAAVTVDATGDVEYVPVAAVHEAEPDDFPLPPPATHISTPPEAAPASGRKLSGSARRVRMAGTDGSPTTSEDTATPTPSRARVSTTAMRASAASSAAVERSVSGGDAVREQLHALRERIRALDAKVGMIPSVDSAPGSGTVPPAR